MEKDLRLSAGDKVRLISKPTGCSSRTLPLTIGKIYTFRYYEGSNVCTTTDDPSLDGHYNQDNVERVVGS